MGRNRTLGHATVAVLNAIRQGALFGLDIMDATGLPSGTVYPTLSRLENRGLVRGRWESDGVAQREGRPRRRYYRVTPEGRRLHYEALTRMGALVADAPPTPAGDT